MPRRLDIEEVLPLNWRTALAAVRSDLPLEFITSVCEFIFQQGAVATEAYELSWLELCIWRTAYISQFADRMESGDPSSRWCFALPLLQLRVGLVCLGRPCVRRCTA